MASRRATASIVTVVGCVSLTLGAAALGGAAPAGAMTSPASLAELRALEAQVVATAKAALPSVVGVNNSAGALVSGDGLVVTAAHLGGLRREKVTVRLADGKTLAAKTLGMWGKADAAMLKVQADGPFAFARLGTTEKTSRGQWCLMFGHMHPRVPGRPPVLRLGRLVETSDEKLVSDCAGTGGDSGGPLFDLQGRLLGVNSYGFPNRMWHVPAATFQANWDRFLRGERWGGRPRLSFTMDTLPRPVRTAPDRCHDLLRPLAAKAGPSTVHVLCDGKRRCLGTIVRADGLVLTKASELSGAASCRLHDGRDLKASQAAVCEEHDLAFLRIEADGLTPVTWSDAEQPEVGRWVLTPSPEGHLVGAGVVSVGQHAVPLRLQKLGAAFAPRYDAPARLQSVERRGAAAKAGLKTGDVITAVDGQATAALKDLCHHLAKLPEGQTAKLAVQRGSQRLEPEVTLASPGGGPVIRQMPGNLPGGIRIITRSRGRTRRGSRRQDGFPAVLQHDASLRPSHCGSPLIGLDGKALGLNIASTSAPGSTALPAALVRQQIAKHAK